MSAVATATGLPTRLGKYEILTPLASGGMARIYVARVTGIGSFERHVVLKLILPERAQDVTSVQMFLDEARLAASLNHQNVAQVFEVGVEAGIHFLAMEYVHGQDLRALLAKAGSAGTRVPLELALTVVAGAAAGLDHAHERRTADGKPMSIVHRDVSPSNLMIGYDGAVKLLDFGIAKAAERSVETQSGIIKGKFAYMAPEQCRGRDVDRRSDVFSLGIILYEVTTQHRCFRADSDFDTMHRIVTGDIVRPSRVVQGYPPALEAIVMKALAVDPVQRYQSAGLLLEAIEGFAAAARLSLSTMSLGRFMRDMFGDLPEPWLMTGGFHRAAPPREQTISSTSESGDAARVPPLPPPPPGPSPVLAPPGLPPPEPPLPGVPGSPAGTPLPGLSVPPGLPAPPPARASSSSSSPALRRPSSTGLSSPALQRPSAPGLPPLHHDQAPMHLPAEIPLETAAVVTQEALPPGWSPPGYPGTAPAAVAVAASVPEFHPVGHVAAGPGAPLGPPHGFPDARAGSGPAHPAMQHRPPHGTQPIAPTRRGYDHAPGVSRSEPRPRFDAHELAGNVSLQPSNRMLYIGIGGVLVGIIVLLAISIADNRGDTPAAPTPPVAPGPSGAGESAPAPGGVAPVRPEAARDVTAARASTDPAAGRRATIHLHVVSTPAGAEVSLSGKPLGVTPLDAETERRTGSEVLTIHRARYQDVTAAVDLGRDYDQTVTLAPVLEPARTPGGGSSSERDGRTVRSPGSDHDPRSTRPTGSGGGGSKRGLPPKDLDCQPPNKLNPYDLACHGHVCKPCPVGTP